MKANELNQSVLREFLEKNQSNDFYQLCQNKSIDFGEHLKQLADLEAALQENTNGLQKRFVGLDLVGNEDCLPFCPFILPQFIKFILTYSFKLRKRLGVRLHFGEVTARNKNHPHYPAFLAHMRHGLFAVKILLDNGIPVRIGHGVALADFIGNDEFKFLVDQKVMIEICPTSNIQLLSSLAIPCKREEEELSALKGLINTFPFCLNTDDDGIIYPISEMLCGIAIPSVATSARF